MLSEVLECFGGAGYVEDTGIPRLYRDGQVLPIWEGTTNVLSLDTLRAIQKEGPLDDLLAEIRELSAAAADVALAAAGKQAVASAEHAAAWLFESFAKDPLGVEAGARRFALTLGRSLELYSYIAWSRLQEYVRTCVHACMCPPSLMHMHMHAGPKTK